jgi:ribose transport system ATP-binding protein
LTSATTNPSVLDASEEHDASNVVIAQRVSKAFGLTKALDDVDIIGKAGTVHAITGENGAGKSTFMKILAGVYKPDSGRILIRGREVHFSSVHEALVNGVSSVFQELTLLPNLTVAENMFLGREQVSRGGLARGLMMRRAREALERVGSMFGRSGLSAVLP